VSGDASAPGAGQLTLSFHGGAGTVTGSRHLLTADRLRVLVDCGMFQGLKELRLMNWRRPGFDPASVDALLLTHAHMDHSGYIPRLRREGYSGKIFCTPPTEELARVLLLDSAKLQEEDADHANRKGYSKHSPALPLYTADDVDVAMQRFRGIEYGVWLDLGGGARARMHNAGHILGSAFIEVEVPRHGSPVRVVFSGDVGRYGVPLHSDPDPLPACDALVIESTYGNRVHSETPIIDQIRGPFTETIRRGGTIVIPSFAMARTQLVTLMLGELMTAHDLPRVPVYVDSPMAIAITKIYNEHLADGELDPGLGDERHSMILPPGVHFCQTVEESKQLNRLEGPSIIIASSGMLTGGRVLHHLERLLPDPKNLVALVGYQAPGTRGWSLVNGAATLRMHGQDVPVRAKVLSVDGMSAHADANELMRWFRSGPSLPKAAFVTHGEPDAAAALAKRIGTETGVPAYTPKLGDQFDLAALLSGTGGGEAT
jgi:metallo-beta-lactamase family protein